MELLSAACVAFLVTHLGISGTPLRAMLRSRLGAAPYIGIYSLISLATFALMIYGYAQVAHADFIWYPSEAAYRVAEFLVFVAIVLLVMAVLVKNPTAVMMEEAVEDDPAGLLKITRHPIQWAILIFAIGHLIANGDLASIWLFGTLGAVSLFGMLSMDMRRNREESEHWKRFMSTTSMVPFLAIFKGRTTLSPGELNWPAALAACVVYAVVYWLHHLVSGGVSLH